MHRPIIREKQLIIFLSLLKSRLHLNQGPQLTIIDLDFETTGTLLFNLPHCKGISVSQVYNVLCLTVMMLDVDKY